MKNITKRFISFFLTIVLILMTTPYAFAESNENVAHVYIRQVYGGGGKGETPIAKHFIELYNPTDAEVDLTGYKINYEEKAVELTGGKIPAKGSYLITGAAEQTTDDLLKLDLPEADKQETTLVINNKSYTITLQKGDTVLDTFTAGGSDETKISKQKSLLKNEDGTSKLIGWNGETSEVNEEYVASYSPKNSKGETGKVHESASTDSQEYTPVVTSDVKVTGYYDENASLKLELAGRYNSGAMNADGGSLEIVQYNPVNGFAYAVSGLKGKVIAIDLNGKLDGDKVTELKGKEYDIKSLVSGFSYGDTTSVSISKDGTMLAAAIQAKDYSAKGIVGIFKCNTDGSLELITTQAVGVQPDMVKFVGNDTILTADEGEPRSGDGGVDPKGSVSIVKLNGNTTTAKTVYFDKYDEKRDELTSAGILIQKGKKPSEDFEPEYIAYSGNTAYVSLQEANAIAVLDLTTQEFTGVYSLGFKDYGKIKIDLEKNDKIELKNYEGVYGIRMPDGIDVVEIGGKTYVLTANEGDSRSDWAGYNNEYENKTSPNGNVTLDSKVVWFNDKMWDGLDSDKSYIFGGRSISMYEATSNGLSLVYDSGSSMEEKTAEKLPEYFNASNDKITLDNRSGKKGPEPETVIAGNVNGKVYAFAALERIGGIMVYDITDPSKVSFVNYVNSREFDTEIQGDVSPEGLCFITENNSKTGVPMLLSACEVSGTLAVYKLGNNNNSTPDDSTDKDLIDEILRAQENETIEYDYTDNTDNPELSSNVFDNLKGQNKTLSLTSGNVVWEFNGKDIKQPSKIVKLHVDIAKASDTNTVMDKNIVEAIKQIAEADNKSAVVVKFADNGVLPGKAKIRIQTDSDMKQYLGNSGLYVYYYNDTAKKMEPIASNIAITNDDYIEFTIEHCSYYVITSGALSSTENNGGDYVWDTDDNNDDSLVASESNSNNSTISSATSSSSNTATSPATGDYNKTGILVLAMLIAVIALTGTKKGILRK